MPVDSLLKKKKKKVKSVQPEEAAGNAPEEDAAPVASKALDSGERRKQKKLKRAQASLDAAAGVSGRAQAAWQADKVAEEAAAAAPKKKIKLAAEEPAAEEEGEEAEESAALATTEAAGGEDDEEEAEDAEEEKSTFAELGVCEQLCNACAEMKYKFATPIQKESIPYALQGRDVIALAETGSGKTAAFAIPVLQSLLEKKTRLFAVVLSPTRELAFQISETFEALGQSIGASCVVLVGGMDMMSQAVALAKRPHVIVASPGRILDHLHNTKGFSLRTIKFLVLDEADKLLSMDFQVAIDKLLEVCPKERNTYLFSATMTDKVRALQRAALTNPVRVQVSSKYGTVKGLVQNYIFFPFKLKDCYLTYLVNEYAGNSVIVFVATCATAQRIALMLRSLGLEAVPLHGQLTQAKRLAALNRFKAGQARILLATDVAARGLDIPSVDLVVNYDVPSNSKDYIHRVGRTARAGRSGRSLTFVTQYDIETYQRIEHLLGKKLDEYKVEEDDVKVLMERVSEAKRIAALDMRDLGMKDKRSNENGDEEISAEDLIRRPRGKGKGKGKGKGGKGKGKGKR